MIEIEKIIQEQNPKLLEKLKGYKLNFLKWLLRIDKINAIVVRNKEFEGVAFAERVLSDFKIKVVIKGLENLNKSEKYIFASNHPSAGFDGLAFICAMSNFTNNFQVIVKDVLCHIENLRPVFTPINTYHKQKNDYVEKLDKIYKSDAQVLILPSGACSRRINGEIKDLNWGTHFIKKSKAYKRNIVPVHISGKNPSYFYFFANLRKKLGIKYNAEELLLPRAVLKQKPTTIIVSFKKPINFLQFNNTKSVNDWAQYVKSAVYQQ